jgi:hypothetical protein
MLLNMKSGASTDNDLDMLLHPLSLVGLIDKDSHESDRMDRYCQRPDSLDLSFVNLDNMIKQSDTVDF